MALLSDITTVHNSVTNEITQVTMSMTTASNSAMTAAMGHSSAGAVADITYVKPTIAPFDMHLDFGDAYLSTYNGLVDKLGPEFNGLMDGFLTKYFPKGLFDDTVSWLDDVIKNGYRGIPDSHYDAIWNKARDREMRDVLRLEDEAITSMSGRGWSIPPGAIASRLYSIQQEANAKIASISREVAIKDVEIKVDMVKFAITESVSLVNHLWGVLLDYIREFLSIQNLAATQAQQFVNAKIGLYDSMYKYYDAVARVEGLSIQVKQGNQSKQIKMNELDIDAFYRGQKISVDSSVSIAGLWGNVLHGMAASRNTLSTQGNFTNITG